jgi:secondary thiamine-phosphate synthase enzyme
VCTVFAAHATAGITLNENADPNIGVDFLSALRKLIVEHDGWLHDRIDDNAAAHIKSALVGPSVSIPVEDGKLALGTWQDVFFCEFDGPRSSRNVIVTIVS